MTLCALCLHRKEMHNGLSCGAPQCPCTGFQRPRTQQKMRPMEPKCFDCSGTDCKLVGETYAFCDDDCRDSFMAGLLA